MPAGIASVRLKPQGAPVPEAIALEDVVETPYYAARVDPTTREDVWAVPRQNRERVVMEAGPICAVGTQAHRLKPVLPEAG